MNFTKLLKDQGNKPIPLQRPMMAGQQRLLSTPNEFNRVGSLGELKSLSTLQLQAYYYDVVCVDLPGTQSELDSLCGVTRLFNCQPESSVATCRLTNADCGTSINAPFVAMGLCLIAIPDVAAATLPVAVTPQLAGVAAGSDPNCPTPRQLASQAICGCGPFDGQPNVAGALDLPQNAGISPIEEGDLMVGHPSDFFLQKYFTTARLQFLAMNRFLLIDQLASLMCFQPNLGCWDGAAGDWRLGGMGMYIDWFNDVAKCKGINLEAHAPTFIVDSLTGESIQVAPAAAGGLVGGPSGFCTTTRMWPFPCPMFFCPGFRIDINLVPEIPCNTLMGLPENFVPTRVNKNGVPQWTLPTGQVRFGVVLFGVEIWGGAILDFLNCYIAPGSVQSQMLQGVPWVFDHIRKLEASGEKIDQASKNRLYGILGRVPEINLNG